MLCAVCGKVRRQLRMRQIAVTTGVTRTPSVFTR
jgi:hypothetical protein